MNRFMTTYILHYLGISCIGCAALTGLAGEQPATFTVATYNVHNYLDRAASSREPKSAASRAKVHESILAIKPDVLALQEIGAIESLLALRSSLKSIGHDFPYWEWVNGFDTNIHAGILSRYRITATRSQTNASFLLGGRRFYTSRGLGEVDILVPANYHFTLLTTHLKSRRPVPSADEALLRQQEAIVLRARIDALLHADPNLNLVVLGDFNDTRSSPALRILAGKGNTSLFDTRPAERNGGYSPDPTPVFPSRNVAWTYFYGKDDTYSRVDYILLSRGMVKEWIQEESFVLAFPNWGLASDHRPVVATFSTRDQ